MSALALSEGQELSPAIQEKLREKAKADLFFFSKGVLGFSKLTPKIHKPLCRLLELYSGYDETLAHSWSTYKEVLKDAFRRARVPKKLWEEKLLRIRKRGIKKLLIMLPRGWYKTTLCSIAYPLWRGVRDPNVRALLAQNTAGNAKRKGNALAQTVALAPLFRALFSEVLPTPKEKWSEEGRCLKRNAAWAESTYEFAGTNTQVTSRHYNVIIEDDTVAPDKDDLGENAILPSKLDVSQAIGWHQLVPPLLDEIADDQNIVVGTRWFVLDLLKWIMDNEEGFVVYQRAVREDRFGRPSPQGELTWGERFNEEVLLGLAASMGPYMYSCLYMNTPVRSEDMLFKEEWIRYYDVEPHQLMTFTTVDIANDPTDTKGIPDYNVVLTCGKDMVEGKVYVLDYTRERCSPSRLLEMIFAHVTKWHPVVVGVETVGYQKSLKHWIRQWQLSSGNFFAVQELTHTKQSKGGRIRGLQPAISAGVMFFRTHMKALINELLVYPLGADNDDLIDVLAMQLELWRLTPSHQEEKVSMDGGPNEFDTVLALCREEQVRVNADRVRAETTVPHAWGTSVPDLVFQHGKG